MRIRKSLLLPGGLLAIVALLGAAAASAAVPAFCTTANFRVDVAMNTADGITSYQYTMSNVNGSSKNANKFFVYSLRGLEGDLQGTIPGSTSTGTYVTNGTTAASNCPPTGAWTFNEHQDGMCFTSVAMNNQPTLTVSERFKPEEGASSLILTYASTSESCGPILGPTTEAAPNFEGNPIASRTMRQVMEDGCAYILTAGNADNIVTSMTVDPNTPNPPGITCEVVTEPDLCRKETGLSFCPPTVLGLPGPVVTTNPDAVAGAVITGTPYSHCPPAGYPTRIYHKIYPPTVNSGAHYCSSTK